MEGTLVAGITEVCITIAEIRFAGTKSYDKLISCKLLRIPNHHPLLLDLLISLQNPLLIGVHRRVRGVRGKRSRSERVGIINLVLRNAVQLHVAREFHRVRHHDQRDVVRFARRSHHGLILIGVICPKRSQYRQSPIR